MFTGFSGGAGGIRFAHRQRLTCAPHGVRRPVPQNPGREKAAPQPFHFRPSNLICETIKEAPLKGCFFYWRRGWDSNPRAREGKLISSLSSNKQMCII